MKKNSLGRQVPNQYMPFTTDDAFLSMPYHKKTQTKHVGIANMVDSLSTVFDILHVSDGMTLSFHHHYRNGDLLLNMVVDLISINKLKHMILAPSAIFPVHEPLAELIKNKQITKIYTNYINGPVADAISQGHLNDLLVMDTHGGRARAIETGEIDIDIAFVAVSAADHFGNANGIDGKHPCGPLGYIHPDIHFAKKVVLVTDTILENLTIPEIDGHLVDYIVKVDQIGLSDGIESGTTQMTKDPIQLKIAKDTVELIDSLKLIKNGLSFQTGAGSTSIAVSHYLKEKMQKYNIKGSFASGGITASLVDMYENGLFDKLYDVQSFDLSAIGSYKKNKNHFLMDASLYANPFHKHNIASKLDIVILGATEIDLNFNVNVTTTSTHKLMGGSGGHADTAYESKLTIITTNLVKSRIPSIRKQIQTITTPGSSVDMIVTERGIAINPLRKDLIQILKHSKLTILSIDELYELGIKIAGHPKHYAHGDKLVGIIRYRDGSIIDSIYEVKK